MEIVVPNPGTYVVAVSGGVDSMVLLHYLHTHAAESDEPYKLIVAHLDHGMRQDSVDDRRLVQAAAQQYGLPFIYDSAHLGAGASEDQARIARYKFLEKVRAASEASAIITAHHQDDALETAIHNMIRGTGRKGITALGTRNGVLRPFLLVPKHEIIAHAREHQLEWHEDSTNVDTAYARNYIRHKILPRFEAEHKQQLHDIVVQLRSTNSELDTELREHLAMHTVQHRLDRLWFMQLPHKVSCEIMAAWLRKEGISGDRKSVV